jgi:hypothetical protein
MGFAVQLKPADALDPTDSSSSVCGPSLFRARPSVPNPKPPLGSNLLSDRSVPVAACRQGVLDRLENAGSGHFRPRETAGRRDKKRTPYLQQPAGTLSQVWTFGSKEKDLRSRLIRTRHVGNLEDRLLLTSGPYRSARQSSGSDL